MKILFQRNRFSDILWFQKFVEYCIQFVVWKRTSKSIFIDFSSGSTFSDKTEEKLVKEAVYKAFAAESVGADLTDIMVAERTELFIEQEMKRKKYKSLRFNSFT